MRGRLVLAGLLGLAALLLTGLGVWQVERRAWKRDLIARTEAKLVADPRPLKPGDWSGFGPDAAYTRVEAAGQWLETAPVFVKAVTAAGPGSWVMSPLRTPAGIVLINRGFVPDEQRREIVPPAGSSVTGLLRLSEPGGAFLRSNDPQGGRWYSRDVAAIARSRGWQGVAPFFIDADAVPAVRWPRGGMTVVRFPDNHLVYALTWFGLASIAGWFAWMAARR
jgi:surfeit locus 1 family protein